MTRVLPADLLHAIQSAAGDKWPTAAFERLAGSDVMRWSIPAEYGGVPVDDVTFTRGYVELAEADLAACFVLTQRNGAVQRIASSDNGEAKEAFLPGLARGDTFATVGISHLTTSRQHTEPAMRVAIDGDTVRLDGMCPWATSATRADLLVTGGQLADGTQLLTVVKREDGFVPGTPMSLLALSGSETGTVSLEDVVIPRSQILAGPIDAVMTQGKGGGAGSLTTSALAVGLSLRAVAMLEEEGGRRTEIAVAARPLRTEVDGLHSDLLAAAAGEGGSAEQLRTRANSLALRSTQALLTATKGAGFLVGHPAERAVREAMFFLVWSCPRPVAEAALSEFACSPSFS